MLHGQTDAYLQDRANTMQSIESTIVELGGIFQQLAHMIKEQASSKCRVAITKGAERRSSNHPPPFMQLTFTLAQ